MKGYIKIISISLGILSGMSMENLAHGQDDWETPGSIMTASGSFMDVKEEEPSALSTMGKYALSSAEAIGKRGYHAASNVTDNLARYGLAYMTSYWGVEALMEGTAWGIYYGAYAVGALSIAGPGAGATAASVAYTMTTTALKGLHMIPGMHGALAATYTPVVRTFTDAAIDHGPETLKSAFNIGRSVLKTTTSMAQTGYSKIYNYLYSW